MTSIKLFLTSTILAVIALAVFVSVIQGYNRSMTASEVLFDSKLEEVAELLSVINFNEDAGLSSASNSQIKFRIWSTSQRLLVKSNGLEINYPQAFEEYARFENFHSARWRSIMKHFPKQQKWVWVSEKQNFRFELAEGLIVESIIPALVMIPLVGFIILLIVSRGMKPIRILAEEIAHKAANDLTSIQTREIPTELTNLTASVNDLFARLEQSFEREKRLASDAAHELRTPIAALGLQVENLVAAFPDNLDVQTLKLTTQRLSHLTEQILTLNKTAPDLFAAQLKKCEISSIIRSVVASYYPKIEQNHHTIEMDAHKCYAMIDESLLEIMFGNLLENAIKYTPCGGMIKVSLLVSDEHLFLQVHDNGPGIPYSMRERALERFYRLDGDRNRSSVSGCGLGLSIVQHVVELHRAELVLLDSEFGQGICFQISFDSASLGGIVEQS